MGFRLPKVEVKFSKCLNNMSRARSFQSRKDSGAEQLERSKERLASVISPPYEEQHPSAMWSTVNAARVAMVLPDVYNMVGAAGRAPALLA